MEIFYEYDYVKNMLNGSKKNQYINYNDVGLLACYLKHDIGKSDNQIREDLDKFLRDNEQSFNDVVAQRMINYALRMSEWRKLKIEKDIPITSKEIDIIYGQLDNYKIRKVAFTALVLAKREYDKSHLKKYWDKPYDGDYNLSYRMTQILSHAGIHMSKSNRMALIHTLHQEELITFHIGRKNKGYYKVEFIDKNDDDQKILVNNLYDIGSFFPFI